MKRVLLFFIDFYKAAISPLLGQNCRFYPSCSTYAHEAICKHGVKRGLKLTCARLIKCGPWHSGGVDFVPEK